MSPILLQDFSWLYFPNQNNSRFYDETRDHTSDDGSPWCNLDRDVDIKVVRLVIAWLLPKPDQEQLFCFVVRPCESCIKCLLEGTLRNYFGNISLP